MSLKCFEFKASKKVSNKNKTRSLQENFKGIILPKQNAAEAAVVEGLEVYGANNLNEIIDFLFDNLEQYGDPKKDIQKAIDFSVKVFSAVRASSLIMIQRLTDADLAKSGIHSESGPFSIENWCRAYTAHPLDHIGQIEKALRGEN